MPSKIVIDPGDESDDESQPDRTPFQKKYFSADMMSKYEPLVESMAAMEEASGEDPLVNEQFQEHWQKFMDFSWCSDVPGKTYDIIFYGMSGYSGYLMMEYLKRVALKNVGPNFSMAFAGRSAAKVAEMRDREFAGTKWADTAILAAGFDDCVSIINLVKSAHVIVNVAGPYMLTEGEVLVDACIWCKTDYVDISQEIPWSQRIKELHKYAVDAGVMIVPSAAGTAYADLGAFLLAKKLREDYGEATRSVACYCTGGGSAAGISGGSVRTRAALSSANKDEKQKMGDAFSLGGFIPSIDRWGRKAMDVQFGTGIATPKLRPEDSDDTLSQVSEDKKLGVWRAPYVHASFDTRVVRRSNMLQADLGNQPYGTSFNFVEYALLPREEAASVQAAFRKGDLGPLGLGPRGKPEEAERSQLEASGKTFSDGRGPGLNQLSDAWTGFFFHGESTGGHSLECSFVAADGYFETARVAVETALTLRFDRDRLPYRGGVLTPSVAGGTCLVERLLNGVDGVRFKMGGWPSKAECTPPGMSSG